MSETERPGEPELVEPEPEVVQGEDDLPRQPTLTNDPFTPAPAEHPGNRAAYRLAWVALAIIVVFGVVIAVWAALR